MTYTQEDRDRALDVMTDAARDNAAEIRRTYSGYRKEDEASDIEAALAALSDCIAIPREEYDALVKAAQRPAPPLSKSQDKRIAIQRGGSLDGCMDRALVLELEEEIIRLRGELLEAVELLDGRKHARREAFEEAAKIADDLARSVIDGATRDSKRASAMLRHAYQQAAADIRAAAEKEE